MPLDTMMTASGNCLDHPIFRPGNDLETWRDSLDRLMVA
jgi:hypothetical protein